MSIPTDLNKTFTHSDIHDATYGTIHSAVSKQKADSLQQYAVITQHRITKAQNIQTLNSLDTFTFYTTKHGSAWFQQNDKDLNNCLVHKSLEDAIDYAESNLCTIICVKAKTVIWSGGPNKAKYLDLQKF